jgi:hypothetical protein
VAARSEAIEAGAGDHMAMRPSSRSLAMRREVRSRRRKSVARRVRAEKRGEIAVTETVEEAENLRSLDRSFQRRP